MSVSWVDSPLTISEVQKLKSIIIDVKNAAEERLYKITFFVKSGLIQTQGSHHSDFTNTDFSSLLSIVHHLSGPLPGTEGLNSDQTELKKVHREQHPSPDMRTIADSTNKSNQQNEAKGELSMSDINNNLVKKGEIERLEEAFVNAIVKLEQATSNNKNEIIQRIDSLSPTKENSLGKMKSLNEKILSLEAKLQNMKEEIKSKEQQVQSLKANSLLQEELQEHTLTHERKILEETRDQVKKLIQEKNEDYEHLNNKIHEKQAENESLNQTIKDLTIKLNLSKDEVIQIKTSMASSLHSEPTTPTAARMEQLKVLLVGTSNIEGIKAEKLTTAAQVQKVIKYTLNDTSTYLQSARSKPTVLVLHSLTNDLKKNNPQQCVNELFELVANICSKWPLIKVVISQTTPRHDSMNNSTSAQIINVLLKQKFLGVDNISFATHGNMFINGNPNSELLQRDGIHLTDKGISLFAGNLKRAIHIALDVPVPPRRMRSKSPGNRGRR